MTNPLLQKSPYEVDAGELIGRHPSDITAQEYMNAGHNLLGIKAIRAKCLDCAGTLTEVRKCVCTDCPLWPLRMGKAPKGLREARSKTPEGATC